MWTAEEAAKKSQYYRHDFIYNKICDAIKRTVEMGERECVIPDRTPDSVKKEFEALGYKVLETWECFDGVNKFSHISITW